MASGGLNYLIYINNLQSSLIIFANWKQLSEHRTHDTVTGYSFIFIFIGIDPSFCTKGYQGFFSSFQEVIFDFLEMCFQVLVLPVFIVCYRIAKCTREITRGSVMCCYFILKNAIPAIPIQNPFEYLIFLDVQFWMSFDKMAANFVQKHSKSELFLSDFEWHLITQPFAIQLTFDPSNTEYFSPLTNPLWHITGYQNQATSPSNKCGSPEYKEEESHIK